LREADVSDLPNWFHARSPLTCDPIKGPDAQYSAGANDMLAVVRARVEEHMNEVRDDGKSDLVRAVRKAVDL
jgi:hypothetical protein